MDKINFLLLDVDPIIHGAKKNIGKSAPVVGNAMGKNPGSELLYTLFCYAAIFFVAYWILIRPQKKRQK